MVINIKKIIILFCLFFIFDTLEVDSNSSKYLTYSMKDLYFEDNYKIYFNDVNSVDLKRALELVNVRVLSYIIEDKKYYARNIDELVNVYSADKDLERKIYYYNNGIYIDGINIVCDKNELMKLERLVNIY